MRLAPLAALLVLLAAPASAQMMPSGTWTGTLTNADGDRQPVEAAMERCAGGFTLELDLGPRTARVPENAPATWANGRLQFTTSRVRMPGTLIPRRLACDLRAGDTGMLSGTCTSGSERYQLALSPPADASFGCD
ncbi:MAG: hypothetical protein AAGK21_15475 [Bacteroidota bacterium]